MKRASSHHLSPKAWLGLAWLLRVYIDQVGSASQLLLPLSAESALPCPHLARTGNQPKPSRNRIKEAIRPSIVVVVVVVEA